MSTYTQILYQIVFGTKYRRPTLIKPHRDEVFSYMAGVLRNHKCHVYNVNGVEDHVHIITHLHPSVALANVVKDLKISSHKFIDEQGFLPDFTAWQVGYSAFTYQYKALNNLVRYVQNQEAHHAKKSSRQELKDLLEEHGIPYDEKYLE